MADLICCANGLLTAVATWELVHSGSKLVSTNTGVTALTTSPLDCTVFTPGAITIDGIALRLGVRASGSPINKLTVILRNSSDSLDIKTVVVNVSDLAWCTSGAYNDGGWYFFRFDASTLLVAGKNYVIRCYLDSTSTAVSICTNGTANNWQHMLRTTTTQAPTTSDNMYILGEFNGANNPATTETRTVTMDSTATTDYGDANTSTYTPVISIGNRGILAYGGPNAGDPPAAATNYYLKVSGHLGVYAGGTLTVGTVANPIPRDSTAVLEIDPASNWTMGIVRYGAATVTMQGLSRTLGKDVTWCLMSVDKAIGATTIDVDTDTGWLDADEVVIASTTRTASQSELRVLSGNAGGSSFNITAGLTYAHGGSSATKVQAEVILLTRNVRVRSSNSSYKIYFTNNGSTGIPCETLDLDWVSFQHVGQEVSQLTSPGSANIQYCSYRDSGAYPCFLIQGTNFYSLTLHKNVYYNTTAGNYGAVHIAQPTTGTWTITDCVSIYTGWGFEFHDCGGTLSGCRAVACSNGAGFYPNETIEGFTLTNCVAHSGAGAGFEQNASSLGFIYNNCHSWRNGGNGFNMGCSNLRTTFNGCYVFANNTINIYFYGTGCNDVTFNNCVLAGDSSFSTQYGLHFRSGGPSWHRATINNCSLGEVSGIYVAHTQADIGGDAFGGIGRAELFLRDTILASTTEISSGFLAAYDYKSFVASEHHDGVDGAHWVLTPIGIITRETTIYDEIPSIKMTPLSASVKLESNAGISARGFLVGVADDGSVNVSVCVRKDNSYNGNLPRFIAKANPAIGLDTDTVLDTMAVSTYPDEWETLSGTIGPVTDTGIIEFVVDCDGTAGNVYVDMWAA